MNCQTIKVQPAVISFKLFAKIFHELRLTTVLFYQKCSALGTENYISNLLA